MKLQQMCTRDAAEHFAYAIFGVELWSRFVNADAVPTAPLRASLIIQDEAPGPRDFAQKLAEILASYPNAAGAIPVHDSYEEIRRGRWTAEIEWPAVHCSPDGVRYSRM